MLFVTGSCVCVCVSVCESVGNWKHVNAHRYDIAKMGRSVKPGGAIP